MKDLIKLMSPKYIEVWGKFTPRGGISIDPYCNYGIPGTKYEKMADYRMMNHDLYPEKVDRYRSLHKYLYLTKTISILFSYHSVSLTTFALIHALYNF